MKTNKKKQTDENEYWLDELLEQPENHKKEPDGSTLYGYDDEPKLFSQGWWLNTKNAIVMVWAAKNPFNENRIVMKVGLPLVHPDAYRIFFPFTYIMGIDFRYYPPGIWHSRRCLVSVFSIGSRRNSATLHLGANRMRSSYHLLQTNRNRLGMTRELIQAVHDNGLLWYLLRGVSDGLSDSLDDTAAKQTAEDILALLPSVSMDQSTRARMTAYLLDVVRFVTIDAESIL